MPSMEEKIKKTSSLIKKNPRTKKETGKKSPAETKKGREGEISAEIKREPGLEDILAEIEKTSKIETAGKQDAKKTITPLTYKTPLRLYRRIALFFTLVTVGVLVSALYFALAKAEVRIKPHEYAVNAEFNVNIENVPLSENGIAGKMIEEIKSESEEFDIAGEGEIRDGVAQGEVRLFNNTSTSQILVQKTRLLSEDGILFRLTNKVNVPARGSIVASVYADRPGPDGDIEPAKFTIPGLNTTLQKSIYAVSDKPMSGGRIVVKIVNEKDIIDAKNAITDKIVSAVREEMVKLIDETGAFVLWPEVLEETVDSKAGDEREKIKVFIKIRVLSVIYDKAALEKIALEKVNLIVPAERTVKNIMFNDVKIDLVKFDSGIGTATVKVTVPAGVIIKESASVLDKEQLIGLKTSNAKEYLENFEEIDEVKIKTRPFWLRYLPSSAERIKIYIQ